MQPESVGTKLSHWRGEHVAIGSRHVGPSGIGLELRFGGRVGSVAQPHQVRVVLAMLKRSRGSGPAGVLPLRLRRQSIGATFLLAEPFAESVGVVPGDVHHRMSLVLRPAGVLPRIIALRSLDPASGWIEAKTAKSLCL